MIIWGISEILDFIVIVSFILRHICLYESFIHFGICNESALLMQQVFGVLTVIYFLCICCTVFEIYFRFLKFYSS